MNHQQYTEAIAKQGLRIASENESGWTDRYYDETRGETVKTWITDSPTPERIAAIASEVGCTVEQVQGIIDFEAGEKQRELTVEWNTREYTTYKTFHGERHSVHLLTVNIPNGKKKNAATTPYEVLGLDPKRDKTPNDLLKVTLGRRWSGGGIVVLHWRDGSTQETRYGKRERVPSSEGGKSREAKERWI